jgi:hypothetical protein
MDYGTGCSKVRRRRRRRARVFFLHGDIVMLGSARGCFRGLRGHAGFTRRLREGRVIVVAGCILVPNHNACTHRTILALVGTTIL